MESDNLQKFVFNDIDIRGEFVRLNESYKTIMQQHHYPKPIQKFLGETLLAVTLLTATIKFKGQVTFQLQSESAIKLLVAKCSHKFEIRGLAQWDPEASEEILKQGLAKSQLVVTIEQDHNVKPYQSIIQLEDGNIRQALEFYFGQSEQIPTKLLFAVNDESAAGMLLQSLPEQSSHERELFWEHATILSDSLKERELLNDDNQTILHKLYHEEDIRIFAPVDVQFKCHCSVPRMQNAVITFGEQECLDILKEKQVIAVRCEYCNHEYCFDRNDVEKLFQKH